MEGSEKREREKGKGRGKKRKRSEREGKDEYEEYEERDRVLWDEGDNEGNNEIRTECIELSLVPLVGSLSSLSPYPSLLSPSSLSRLSLFYPPPLSLVSITRTCEASGDSLAPVCDTALSRLSFHIPLIYPPHLSLISLSSLSRLYNPHL